MSLIEKIISFNLSGKIEKAIIYLGEHIFENLTDEQGEQIAEGIEGYIKTRVIHISESRDIQPSDNDAILLIKNNVTLTLTSQLQDYFSCNLYVRGSFTATIVSGTETLHAPDGNDITEDKIGLIFRNGAEFILKV